jgi:hypothetical protein
LASNFSDEILGGMRYAPPSGTGTVFLRLTAISIVKTRGARMANIMPQQELLRRAAAWVESERAQRPGVSLSHMLDEAGMRFNLSPNDHKLLENLFIAQEKDHA